MIEISLFGNILSGSDSFNSSLTFSFLYILNLSMEPYQSAKVTASRIARQYADLDKVDRFAIYNGEKVIIVFLGKIVKRRSLLF